MFALPILAPRAVAPSGNRSPSAPPRRHSAEAVPDRSVGHRTVTCGSVLSTTAFKRTDLKRVN